MNNFDRKDSGALAALLRLASSKLGTTPEELKTELDSGNCGKLADRLPEDQAEKLKKALADPAAQRRILDSPQAKAIIEKLGGKKQG